MKINDHDFLDEIDEYWTLFLDRDGVINRRIPDRYVTSIDEFMPLPGVIQCIANLTQLFRRTVVVTNQQGVGKGEMTERDLTIIHDYLREQISGHGGYLDAIYYCPDLASVNSKRRKPAPGMAYEAQQDFPEIDFDKSVMIGDSLSDMEFGLRLGMRTVLVIGKHEEERALEDIDVDLRVRSLSSFCAMLSRDDSSDEDE